MSHVNEDEEFAEPEMGEESPQPVEAPAKTKIAVGPKCRNALVVEDSKVIRRLLVGYMKAFNFKCWEAENGVVALEKLDEMGPGFFSIVLTDLMMPEMGGVEFVANCREKYQEDFPPIVVCSTKSDTISVKTVVSLKISGYILKPFKADTIRGKMASLFDDIPEEL